MNGCEGLILDDRSTGSGQKSATERLHVGRSPKRKIVKVRCFGLLTGGDRDRQQDRDSGRDRGEPGRRENCAMDSSSTTLVLSPLVPHAEAHFGLFDPGDKEPATTATRMVRFGNVCRAGFDSW